MPKVSAELKPIDELDDPEITERLRDVGMYEAADQIDDLVAKIARFRSENVKLQKDFKNLADADCAFGTCESCGAWLLCDDDIVMGEDGFYCRAAGTDAEEAEKRPCYAYRVGKLHAAQRSLYSKK